MRQTRRNPRDGQTLWTVRAFIPNGLALDRRIQFTLNPLSAAIHTGSTLAAAASQLSDPFHLS